MNKFKESLKIDNTKDFEEFDHKVAHAVIQAIDNLKANNKEEEIRKSEMILNLNRFISNYDSSLEVLREAEAKERAKKHRGMNKYR